MSSYETSQQVSLKRRILAPILSAVLAIGVCMPIFSFAAPEAEAVTAAQKQAEAEAALQQLYELEGQLEVASENYFAALAEYQTAVELRDATQAQIEETQAELAEIRERLGARATTMYKEGNISILDVFTSSKSIDEFVRTWEMLKRMNINDADLAGQAEALEALLEEQKAEYEQQVAVADQKSQEAGAAYEEAAALVEQTEALYNQLSAEAAALYEQEQAAAAAAAARQSAGGSSDCGYLNDDGTVTDAATGQVYSSASAYSAATGNAIVDRAYAMLGGNYSWGAVGGSDGRTFDCSGFVSYALSGSYERLGTSATWNEYASVDDPQPGDVCVRAGHVGIYVGNGQMIHASTESTGIILSNVEDGMRIVRP